MKRTWKLILVAVLAGCGGTNLGAQDGVEEPVSAAIRSASVPTCKPGHPPENTYGGARQTVTFTGIRRARTSGAEASFSLELTGSGIADCFDYEECQLWTYGNYYDLPYEPDAVVSDFGRVGLGSIYFYRGGSWGTGYLSIEDLRSVGLPSGGYGPKFALVGHVDGTTSQLDGDYRGWQGGEYFHSSVLTPPRPFCQQSPKTP